MADGFKVSPRGVSPTLHCEVMIRARVGLVRRGLGEAFAARVPTELLSGRAIQRPRSMPPEGSSAGGGGGWFAEPCGAGWGASE